MINIYIINFLLAISTGIGMTLLPIVVTESLGLSLLAFGIIEGITELTSNLLKFYSGNLFDKIKRKKLLFFFPTFFAFLSRIALLFCLSKYVVLFSKLTERVSNGAFSSPRDAFVAKNATNKGLAFGILNCSKTAGCVIGTLLVSMSTLYFGSILDNFNKLIFIAFIVTFFAMMLSCTIKNDADIKEEKVCLKGFKNVFKTLAPIYTLSFVFFLARFNDGVLIIQLKKHGFPEWFYLSTISFFNIVMFIISPFLGLLLDKKKSNIVLYITIAALLVFNASFYVMQNTGWFFASLGLVGWGIQRAGAQIVFSFMIASLTPKKYLGTAIGVLALTNAAGTLIASISAGFLANKAIFINGFIVSIICLSLNYFFNKKTLITAR